MCGYTEPHTGPAYRGKIRGVEIGLAKMDEIAARLDCVLPIIIDDELRAVPRAERFCLFYLSAEYCTRLILDPQLHKPYAARQEPRDPSRAVNDQIERIKHAHDRRRRARSPASRGPPCPAPASDRRCSQAAPPPPRARRHAPFALDHPPWRSPCW